MLKVLGFLVILLNLFDNYTTFRFLNATSGSYVVVEGNPVVRTLMQALGVKTSLGFEMAGMAVVAVFLAETERLAWRSRLWALIILALLPLWAVLNNLQIALLFHLSLF
jgi:hypothetical protein